LCRNIRIFAEKCIPDGSRNHFAGDEYNSLKGDNDELLKLLTAIIKKTRENGEG
jgi:hypothetical protein